MRKGIVVNVRRLPIRRRTASCHPGFIEEANHDPSPSSGSLIRVKSSSPSNEGKVVDVGAEGGAIAMATR